MTSIARSNLLYHQDEDESYFSSDKPSYYKRSNLQSPSFRQKYKGFRTRSSSYTSLDDKNSNDGLLNYQDASSPSTSLFSRKRLGMTSERSTTAPAAYFATNKQEDSDDDTDSDENTFFAKKSNYSRQNLGNRSSSSSWKSCVLRAVGVKSTK